MTGDEILEKLEKLGIILNISGEWMITEKYKELLDNKAAPPSFREPEKINVDNLLNVKRNGAEWPTELLDTVSVTRFVAFCNICEIPRFAQKGYPLRGFTKEASNILGNYIAEENIDPPMFIEAISLYYKHSDMPKAVKNLLAEDAFEIYKEHVEGKLVASLTGKGNDIKGTGNSQWQN